MHPRSKFTWSFSGYATQKEAETARDDMLLWFNRTFNDKEWTINSTVGVGHAGYTAMIHAQREANEA